MKKRNILFMVPIVLCILISGYLWYAHASIYWKLGDLPIFAPTDYASYTVGEQPTESLTYVAIGDSLTAGVGVDSYTQSYPYRIATNLSNDTKRNVKLVPFAIPGIRSEYVAGYFLEPAIASKPDIITILIGTNDIHGNVPNKVFRAHYKEILQRLTEGTTAQVYAVGVPSIGTKDLISLPYRYYFNWRIEQYNTIIKELAAEYKVTFVDLYTAQNSQSLDNSYYARDFFHPNALGYTQWADYIYASFNK